MVQQQTIINKISKEDSFKFLCKKIAGRLEQADELYQEFFLALCEIKDNRLVDAYNGGYINVFCVGIINNIWGTRNRVKTYEKGRTSPLYELSGNLVTITSGEKNYDEKGAFVHEDCLGSVDIIDYDNEGLINEIRVIIDKYKDSNDESERFRARVFDYSKFMFKNTRQFSKASNIPYNVCLEAYNAFKSKLEYSLKQKKCSLY